MLAVRIHAPGGKLALEEVPLPEPSGSEVRVRVAGCGVCHTDVHIARGEMTRVSLPLTLGHEVSGWVETTLEAQGGLPVGTVGYTFTLEEASGERDDG